MSWFGAHAGSLLDAPGFGRGATPQVVSLSPEDRAFGEYDRYLRAQGAVQTATAQGIYQNQTKDLETRLDTLFPGTSSWERLGAGGAGASGSAGGSGGAGLNPAPLIQARLQERELKARREIARLHAVLTVDRPGWRCQHPCHHRLHRSLY